MSFRNRRVKEMLNGIGKVYEDNKPTCEVQYRLQIMQEFIISLSSSGSEELPGLENISGQIHVISGEKDLADGNIMVLQLEDGRKWKFFVSSGDCVSGNYHAVNASREGIVAS